MRKPLKHIDSLALLSKLWMKNDVLFTLSKTSLDTQIVALFSMRSPTKFMGDLIKKP